MIKGEALLKQLKNELSFSLLSVVRTALMAGMKNGRKIKKDDDEPGIMRINSFLPGNNGNKHLQINGEKIGRYFDEYIEFAVVNGWEKMHEVFQKEILLPISNINKRGFNKASLLLAQKKQTYASRIEQFIKK